MRGTATAVAAICIVVVCVGFSYVAWRYYSVSSTSLRSYFVNHQPFASVLCFGAEGDFIEAATDVHLYAAGPMLRVDWTQYGGASPAHLHMISLDTGMHVYLWADESRYPPALLDNENVLQITKLAEGQADDTVQNCKPWWFPDKSMFVVPPNMDFAPYTQ